MSKSTIEWTDETWNPIAGCTKVSAGCKHCYAERMAKRLVAMGVEKYDGTVGEDGHWTGSIRFDYDALETPFKWRKPRRVFVNSMSDLFHEAVPWHFIQDVFWTMRETPWHTYQVLTKRPERMRDYVQHREPAGVPRNVWLGVSVEDQEAADARIPYLLDIPACVRFLSCEPLLGPVDLGLKLNSDFPWDSRWVRLTQPVWADLPFLNRGKLVAQPGIYRTHSNKHGALSVETSGGLLGVKPSEFEVLPTIDWVICGGESGPGARPMHPEWVRSLRDQCVAAGVPFFFKQWGQWMSEEAALGLVGDDYDLSKKRPIVAHNEIFYRFGTKNAGRLLDGREWNEFPGSCP